MFSIDELGLGGWVLGTIASTKRGGGVVVLSMLGFTGSDSTVEVSI